MKHTVNNRTVIVEYPVIITVLLCLGWSVYYLFSTIARPKGGAESVLFIKPLVIVLAVSAIFAIASAVRVQFGEEKEKSSDRGILHPQRLVFSLSLFVYAATLPFLGYLIPTLLYLGIMCFYLGLRKYWVYLGLWVAYTLLLWFAFKRLMGVPIPIWPIF